MHTASSASCTARESRSASLYATTDAMSSLRQARRMRSAISRRFAIRILLKFATTQAPLRFGFHARDWLAVLNRLARLHLVRLERAAHAAHDLVAHAQDVDVADRIATAHARAAVQPAQRREVADCRRGDYSAVGVARRPVTRSARCRCRLMPGGRARSRGLKGVTVAHRTAEPDAPAGLTHLELAQLALGQALDERGHNLVSKADHERAALGGLIAIVGHALHVLLERWIVGIVGQAVGQ